MAFEPCLQTELAVSALQVEYPAPKNGVIDFTTIRRVYFVSVWHSVNFFNYSENENVLSLAATASLGNIVESSPSHYC